MPPGCSRPSPICSPTPPNTRRAAEHVTLHAEPIDGQVIINVRDTGVGIPSEELDKVFDLFVQSDHTLHRSDGGMGIGLTLVRSIVEMHNGRVAAHSDGPGCGSQFELEFPRLKGTQGGAKDRSRRMPARPLRLCEGEAASSSSKTRTMHAI